MVYHLQFSELFCTPRSLSSAESVANLMASKVVESSGGFLCLICNNFVKLKGSMRRHIVESHMQSNIIFACPICKNHFKNRNSFSVHIYTKHPELKGADYKRFAFFSGSAPDV